MRREIEATLERGRKRYGRKLLGCIKDVITAGSLLTLNAMKA